MKITHITLATVLSIFLIEKTNAESMVFGDENNVYQPTDEDFKKISKAREYLDAKSKLIEAQKKVTDALGEDSHGVVGTMAGSNNGSAAGVPRALRGSAGGDSFIDEKGNRVQAQQDPTTYVSCVVGMGGNLVAELVWADQIISVKRGDPLIGGNWEVTAINQDSIVVANGEQKIRIGKLPIKIRTITGE